MISLNESVVGSISIDPIRKLAIEKIGRIHSFVERHYDKASLYTGGVRRLAIRQAVKVYYCIR